MHRINPADNTISTPCNASNNSKRVREIPSNVVELYTLQFIDDSVTSLTIVRKLGTTNFEASEESSISRIARSFQNG